VHPAAANSYVFHDTTPKACLTGVGLLADAVIVNYNLGIRDIFQEHGSGKDILFSKDYGGNSIINAGNRFL